MKKNIKIAILSISLIILLYFLIMARTAISNILKGYVHFPKQKIGNVLTMEDGQKFTIFRRLIIDGEGDNPDSLAVFKVRFKFNGLSIKANKRLSIIPAPFLMGMKGFREKNWTINENTNDFQGIYQWSTKEMAEKYPDTFIFKVMTKRSAPGTVSYQIIPHTDISQYLSTRRDK